MRLLICAGRYYADSRLCRRVLDAFQRLHPVRVLIHGGNQYLGGDIEEWAREHGADIVRYPPNWQRHGKLAERMRNHFMLLDSRPDVVIALPGGEDTEELVARARTAGLQTLSVEDRGLTAAAIK
ncbi:SLOG family protein [Pseudomonas sp.]|uniref:SLOG family protein n=1 Tax=Pseudomonas sp. TaxID=306 RepID=UPI002488F554|nr:SLOG family protein [Pseudomonas sp.]MDI1328652.1 SLOG family protein [Pseudomonas sp.]